MSSIGSIQNASEKIHNLYQKALKARENSHSPYSGCKVGAAILTTQGIVFTGCNVENASYGATVCAERVAVQKAISEVGKIEIQEVLVITDATPPWPPCGMCRQVLNEFGRDFVVHSANLKGDLLTYQWNELYPQAFTPAHLLKSSS